MRYSKALPLPFVVVEIAPSESPSALRDALVAACTRAAQRAVCVDASVARDTEPTAVARVSWKDAANVRLDVAVGPRNQWVAREITFGEHDPPVERWRTVGLLAGTLANVVLRREATDPAVVPAPPVAAITPPPSVDPADALDPMPPFAGEGDEGARVAPSPGRPGIGFVSVAGTLGSALDRGPVRIGAELGGALRVGGSGLHLAAGAAYSESAGRIAAVKTTWLEAFVGLLYAKSFANGFVGIVHGEALGERFAPSTTLAGTEGPTSGERWLGGFRIGSDVCWRSASGVGVFGGAYGHVTAGTTEVRSGGEVIGVAPLVGYGLRLGLLYGL